MSNKLPNIKERVLQLAELQEGNKQVFFKKIGMTYGNFTGKAKDTPLNSKAIENILLMYPSTNLHWLITGEGEMIKSEDTKKYALKEQAAVYSKRTDVLLNQQNIPLYNIEASAGLVELFRHPHDEEVVDTISIPHLPKCDGAVYVTGDSMYPLLKSGDIVMYKEINNINEGLFWGEIYLISVDLDGEEYISVKYIQKSDKGDDYIKLVSQNTHHQPRDIKLERVRALALVKASIRINSMN